jgi:CDP-4-dehydro-6-deoxyglucose reductase
MTHRITVLPSKHQFDVQESETILDAALRSGLNMNYSCSSGSCGKCKARIVSGQHQACKFFDYVLPESDKQQNVTLLCSTCAGSDLVIEAHEAKAASDIPRQCITARIAKLESAGDNLLILHMRTPRSQTLRFLAGQYVTMTFNGVPPRDMALASCPCNGMVLQFHVQRNDNDAFAVHVFNEVTIGENVMIEGPFGEFTLDEDSKRPLVMVGHDTGFAPLKSLIEHAIALELEQSMVLFWVASANHAHYLSNYCRAWEDALDRFVFIPLSLNSESDDDKAYSEVAQEIIARSPIESEIDLYLATPSRLGAMIAQAYKIRGTPPTRIAITGTC